MVSTSSALCARSCAEATCAEVVEYAVWAEPPEDQLIVLECIVNELAVLSDVPAFKPHVTLWRATMPIDSDVDVLIAEVCRLR